MGGFLSRIRSRRDAGKSEAPQEDDATGVFKGEVTGIEPASEGNAIPGGDAAEEAAVEPTEAPDQSGMAIEKVELAVEKVERVDASTPRLMEAVGDGRHVPDDSDDPGYSTFVPLTESELPGAITLLGSDNIKELFDTAGDDTDPDDLT